MSFKINAYDPTATGYAPRIKHEDWEKHRAAIAQLHSKRVPRKVMLTRLRDEHNFLPTLGQLQAKCKEWNLKVYAKESVSPKHHTSEESPPAKKTARPSRQALQAESVAFHLAYDSNFVQEWADDYRVHPLSHTDTSTNDHSLPPEYIGGGLLANTVDSHWPLPETTNQSKRMLQAGHYYFSILAFQQAFSIYRAVYLYQRRHLSICDLQLIHTVLQCSSSAVTEHQRNIMHSVLCEIGASSDIDSLPPLVLDCLQAASLSMLTSDVTCDIETVETSKARATAHLRIFNHVINPDRLHGTDLLSMHYDFEHSLLLMEHDEKVLQSLLRWCETVVERLHREIDDIFVGQTRCADEYHRRVSQVLSGYLLSEWNKPCEDQDDQRRLIMNLCDHNSFSFYLCTGSTQIIAALAYVIIDAVRCDPTRINPPHDISISSGLWFADAAKLFKRGIRMLCHLDDRSRCAVFSDIFLERFYTPVSSRQTSYHWTTSLPAIVDTVGMSLAQEKQILASHSCPLSAVLPVLPLSPEHLWRNEHPITEDLQSQPPVISLDTQLKAMSIEYEPPIVLGRPSANTDCDSIASFVNTYHRLKVKLDSNIKSGSSTPGDLMSLSSSFDFKFGLFTAPIASGAANVDSYWQMVRTSEDLSIVG